MELIVNEIYRINTKEDISTIEAEDDSFVCNKSADLPGNTPGRLLRPHVCRNNLYKFNVFYPCKECGQEHVFEAWIKAHEITPMNHLSVLPVPEQI